MTAKNPDLIPMVAFADSIMMEDNNFDSNEAWADSLRKRFAEKYPGWELDFFIPVRGDDIIVQMDEYETSAHHLFYVYSNDDPAWHSIDFTTFYGYSHQLEAHLV